MILSRERGFVFVRTRKTASTSVELSLRRYTGPRDIITMDTDEDEARGRELGLPGPQNHVIRHPPWRWRRKHVKDLRRGHWPSYQIREHSSAALIARLFPDEWNAFFSFAFVRNPWDYAVSRWFWQRERGSYGDPDITLDDSITEWDPAMNWRAITQDGEVIVDFVGRYENLVDDLGTALCKAGIDFDGYLPRTKISADGRRPHYRDVLSDAQADRIGNICVAEIERFGYQF